MPIDWKTLSDYSAIIQEGFRRNLPDIDPTIFASWAEAFSNGTAAGVLALQGVAQDIVAQAFPQTARGEYLALWGGYENLPKNDATSAYGTLSQVGTVPTVINHDDYYRGANGKIYKVGKDATIDTVTGNITSITRVGTTATVTTTDDHNLGSGQTVTIAGADQQDYNGPHDIIVLSRTTYQYDIIGTPITPATGIITYTIDHAVVEVQAIDTGIDTNIASGAQLTNITDTTGLDGPGVVTYDGISGGADVETDNAYRDRIILSRSIIEGVFTAPQIELAAKRIPGNTRVFVITPNPSQYAFPQVGQVAVYVFRDNDPSVIPSQYILDITKQSIIDFGKLPADRNPDDLFVLPPDFVTVDFTFNSIDPDTPTMRIAIQNQIKAFFEDSVQFATNVQADSYRGAIQNTYDISGGTPLISFDLLTPTGNIGVSVGKIAIQGAITFL
jgi:uncharacterized phage protein gp47/JayE